MGLKNDTRIDALELFSPAVRKKIEEAARYPPLPDWPVQVRGIPNICLRSALFGLVQRGRRRAVKGELLAQSRGSAFAILAGDWIKAISMSSFMPCISSLLKSRPRTMPDSQAKDSSELSAARVANQGGNGSKIHSEDLQDPPWK